MASADGQQHRAGYTFLVAFVASIGGFLFGYDLHVITGGQLFWKHYFGLDESAWAYGFAMASASIGCMLGPSLGPLMIDRFGRRSTLMFCAILFGASALGTALPNEFTTFNIFRIVGGLAIGLASVASPMYIAEIAPAHLRGRLGLMFQMAVTIGSTCSILVCWWLARLVDRGDIEADMVWRYMFGSELVPIALFYRPADVELVQFGLMPEFIGQGLGGWFIRWIVDHVWSRHPERFWLHTCTLDHPAAVPNYRKAGFVQYKQETIRREL